MKLRMEDATAIWMQCGVCMKKATQRWLLKWWAHQDLNLRPKDYEQLQEIKPVKNQ
jgi:hypothetical protein